jgi:hypothetical protein
MKKTRALSQKGFIGTFVLVIGALLTLQFAFHIDVLAILQSPPMLTISHFIIRYTLIAWEGVVSLYKLIVT